LKKAFLYILVQFGISPLLGCSSLADSVISQYKKFLEEVVPQFL